MRHGGARESATCRATAPSRAGGCQSSGACGAAAGTGSPSGAAAPTAEHAASGSAGAAAPAATAASGASGRRDAGSGCAAAVLVAMSTGVGSGHGCAVTAGVSCSRATQPGALELSRRRQERAAAQVSRSAAVIVRSLRAQPQRAAPPAHATPGDRGKVERGCRHCQCAPRVTAAAAQRSAWPWPGGFWPAARNLNRRAGNSFGI